MTKANGQAPPPGKFEQVRACGATYKLSHITPGIRKAFAAWVEEQALARLEEARPRLTQLAYVRREEWLAEQIMAGAYDWGFPLDEKGQGAMVSRAMREGDGPVKLAQLLLEEHHGPVSAEEIARAWKEKSKDFNAAIQRALDPNLASPSQSEETGTTAGPETMPEKTASPTPTSLAY